MRSWTKSKVYERVLVHTLSGDSYDGLLVRVAKDGLVLEDASLWADGRNVKVAGTSFIPRAQVRAIQADLPARSETAVTSP